MVQAPTVARLAEFIRATTSIDASQSSLVPLRTSGTGLPLFIVSGWIGMYYSDLLSDLKSDRPVFNLQPPLLDGKYRVPRTIEAMAADHVTEIQRVQPHGPYFLAGLSFGGRVCFEVAQRLAQEDERVSFLGLIDTAFRDKPVSLAARLSRQGRHVHGLQELLFGGLRYVRNFRKDIRNITRNRVLDLCIRLGRSIPHEYRAAYTNWLNFRASRNYVPKPYTGHITIFSSAGNSERRRIHWGPIAGGGLTILEVPADLPTCTGRHTANSSRNISMPASIPLRL
jgi:aspartate racemase